MSDLLSSDLPEALKAAESPDPAGLSLPDRYARWGSACKRILCRAGEDISSMPLTPDTPEFELVPRIRGWRPIPSARIIRAAELQKGRECPLCRAGAQAHSEAWHAYGVKKDVAAAVRAAQDAGVSGVTPQIAKRHFTAHQYLQPAPLKRISNDEMMFLAEALSDRERRIMQAVYRQRVLSTRQIADVFVAPESKDDTTASKSVLRTLGILRYGHFLYQYQPREKKSAEKFYFLGRHGVPYVESVEGRLVGESHVVNGESVREYMIEHDSLAADVFVRMRKQLYAKFGDDSLVEVGGRAQHLHLPTDSWHGARSLQLGFIDPFSGVEQKLVPDGFAALTIGDTRLPFFYEWDSGKKTPEDTVEQLCAYAGLAISGAAARRFPQLDVAGYFPPVLLVTSTPTRAYKLAQMAREACSRFGEGTVPPMFITSLDTMRNGAFTPGAWHDVHGEPSTAAKSIAEHLQEASVPLTSAAPLSSRVQLEIDLDAARPKAYTHGQTKQGPAAAAPQAA